MFHVFVRCFELRRLTTNSCPGNRIPFGIASLHTRSVQSAHLCVLRNMGTKFLAAVINRFKIGLRQLF